MKYGITIGVEGFRSDVSETVNRTEMNLPAGSLGNLLDKIVATDSRYRWKEINGEIQVFPVGHREELLNVKVHIFSINGDFDQSTVANSICHLPEVDSKMKSLRISAFNPLEMSLGRVITHHYSVQMHDVTVRELLFEIAKHSEYHFWCIGRWAPYNETITLVF